MKKIIVFLLMISVLCFGCSNENKNLHNFDKSKLTSQLKEASFQPKLPTQLPFKAKNTKAEMLKSQNNVIDIFFTGENGEQMGLQIVKGKVNYSDDLKREKVAIGKNKGSYVKNDAGAMMLEWEDNGIHYDLTYFSKQSGKETDKSDLIQTAKSFK